MAWSLAELKKYKRLRPLKARGNKYGAVSVTLDGIRFHSKKESAYYINLKSAKAAGLVRYWHRQVPLDLGGGVKYLIDFLVVLSDGSLEYVEVKGKMTAHAKDKIKLAEAQYAIKIKII